MFKEVPRYVGFPNQCWVETKFAFDSFEKTFKNKVPFFVSTFRYKDKETPVIDNLLFDIDSYFSLRIPYRNIKLLKDFCYKRDIPYIIDFSGGKGFHFFMLLKPMVAISEKTKDNLRDIMYSTQLRIAKDTGIEAFDEPTFGRLRFLVRYPTSKYIRQNEDTGAYETNELYCRNLTDEEFDAGLKKIIKTVAEPGEVPNAPKSDITLQSIVDGFKDFKIKHRENSKVEMMKLTRAGSTVPTVAAIGVPCLQELAKHSHPTHYERVELVAFLKFLGYTDLAINAFIRKQNWTRYKSAVTSYQVSTIKPRYPKCEFLKKSYKHLCSKCSLRKR